MTGDVRPAFEWFAAVEGNRYRVLFFSVAAAYVFATLRQAIGYGATARLFPLVVSVPLCALLLVELAAAYGDRQDRAEGPFAAVLVETHSRPTPAESDAVRYRRTAASFGWLGGLVAAVWLVGPLPATLAYVPAFVRAHGGSRRRAAVTAIATGGALYVLFVALLSTPLVGGAI